MDFDTSTIIDSYERFGEKIFNKKTLYGWITVCILAAIIIITITGEVWVLMPLLLAAIFIPGIIMMIESLTFLIVWLFYLIIFLFVKLFRLIFGWDLLLGWIIEKSFKNNHAVEKFQYQLYYDRTLVDERVNKILDKKLEKYNEIKRRNNHAGYYGRRDLKNLLKDRFVTLFKINLLTLVNKTVVLNNFEKDEIYLKGMEIERRYPYGFTKYLAEKLHLKYDGCPQDFPKYCPVIFSNITKTISKNDFNWRFFMSIIKDKNAINTIKIADEEIKQKIKQLKNQEYINWKYNDSVLSNPKRQRYIQEFIQANEIITDVKEYCLGHLRSLDDFCEKQIEAQYHSLESSYPLGVEEYKRIHPKYSYFECIQDENVTQIQQYEIQIAEFIQQHSDLVPQCLKDGIQNPENIKQILLIKKTFDQKRRLAQSVKPWPFSKAGMPYYNFTDYYPRNRFPEVTDTNDENRWLIWSFKDGGSEAQQKVLSMVEEKIKETFSPEDMNALTFVCVPAHSSIKNNRRYQMFSKNLCTKLGLRNAFEKIRIKSESQAQHLGANAHSQSEYELDELFFEGANVILFDDIITTGHSLQMWKRLLTDKGAQVICAIAIGKTV